MASNIEFVEFICSQLQELGHIRFRKMFGDYMVYVNEKLLLMLQRSKKYLQLIIPQYFISNKSGIWSLSLIVHSKG